MIIGPYIRISKEPQKCNLNPISVSWGNYKALRVTITVKRPIYNRKTLTFLQLGRGCCSLCALFRRSSARKGFFLCPKPVFPFLLPLLFSFLFTQALPHNWSPPDPAGLFPVPLLPHHHFWWILLYEPLICHYRIIIAKAQSLYLSLCFDTS